MSELPLKFFLDNYGVVNIEIMSNIINNQEEKVNVSNSLGIIMRESSVYEIYKSWFEDKNLSKDFVHMNVKDINLLEIFNKINIFFKNKINIDDCFFEKIRNKYTPSWKWLIFGSSACYSKKHSDMYGTSSWNYLVYGAKKWKLYIVSESDLNERIIEFYQNPGELIWIPENIFHEVEYLKESICLSQNLILKRSEKTILNNILKNDSYESNFIKTYNYINNLGD